MTRRHRRPWSCTAAAIVVLAVLAVTQSVVPSAQPTVPPVPRDAAAGSAPRPSAAEGPARCRWYAAAIRLARSIQDVPDSRAAGLRAELTRLGITADTRPPAGCDTERGGPPSGREGTGDRDQGDRGQGDRNGGDRNQVDRDRGDRDRDAPGAPDSADRTGPAPPQPPAGQVVDPPGRIALSADGNQHDQDDWASSAMSLALLAARGLQADVVHYDYNDHIWDSDEEFRKNMTESVLGAGERFGFDMSRFFDDTDPDQLDAGVANLTAEIDASGPGDELWLVLAGPMETAWMALDAADPQARRYVKCLSHGKWNETHGATDHGGHSYDDLIDLGCRRVQIPDQNSNLGKTGMSDWDYLNDLGDDMRWLYSRIALHGDGDVSDAGMVYYVLTGDERGSRSDLRSLLQDRAGAPRAAGHPGRR